jgi:zinc protease
MKKNRSAHVVALSLLPVALLAVALLTAGLPAVAQTQAGNDTPLPIDTAVRTGRLANGLTYYIRRNTRPEKKAELRLVVNAGSILEDKDQQGLAHFCEHMAFKGSKHFPKTELISYLQSIGVEFGADLNAYTSFDETVYILPIPLDKPDNLEHGFLMLEDWAHFVNYDNEDIDKERNVILEESRLGKGAGDRMFRKIYPKLYAGSKYALRLPIGKDSLLRTFRYETLKRFYHDWYRPDLMAVIVVGDIDPAAVEVMLRRHFSAIHNPINERPRTAATVPLRQNTEAMLVTDKEATHTVVNIDYPFFPDPPVRTIKEYRRSLLRNLFLSMLNERLTDLSKQEIPPFTFPGAGFGSMARGYAGFTLSALTVNDDAGKALTALTVELERIKKYGFTAPELERAKKQLLSDLERELLEKDKTESGNYVDEYLQNFLVKEAIPGIEAENSISKKLAPGISLEEIGHEIDRISSNEHRLVVVKAPDKAGLALPDDKEILAIVDRAEHGPVKPYEDHTVAAVLMTQKPSPGTILSETTNDSLGTVDLLLSNQVRVTLKRTDFKNDEIKLYASRKGGIDKYGPEDKIDATFATAVIGQMGIGDFSPTDIQKINTGKKAAITPTFSGTHDVISGSSSVKDLETMLQMLYLYVEQPRKDEKLFNSFRQTQKAIYGNLGGNPQVAFVDTLIKTLYHHSPLTPLVIPRASDFDKIDLDRVMAIYKEQLGDVSGMHFTFVGSFDPDTLRHLIKVYIASLPSTGQPAHFTDNGLRPTRGRAELKLYKGKEKKSLIVVEYTGEAPYSQELELRLQVLTDILNIKLIDVLRVKMSDIYGGNISGELTKYPYNNYAMILQLPCAPEHVDTLLQAVAAEIENIRTNGPEQKDLEKVRQTLKEKHMVNIKTNDYWTGHLNEIAAGDEDPGRILHFADYLDALTVKDIRETAKLIFDGKNVLQAVLYPETDGK